MLCTAALALAASLDSRSRAWGLRLTPAASLEGDARFFDATPVELTNATQGYRRAAKQLERALSLRAKEATTFPVAAVAQAPLTPTSPFRPFQGSGPSGPTFQSFVDGHHEGRGVWKWNNALVAYQRHFAAFAGSEVHVAEVGVQSGGSIEMWQAVLGDRCYVHGIDINKACTRFTNGRTTMTIGDQASPQMWESFFNETAPKLDILVDDGGHEAHQMRTTLTEGFVRLQLGGVIAIEDIHGQHYIQSFFTPAAHYLAHMASQGAVESVHVYPFLLVVHKTGQAPGRPKARVPFSDGHPIRVESFESFWQQAPANPGRILELRNQTWGNFFTPLGLTNFFAFFGGLHEYSYVATPSGCETTAAPVCRVEIANSPTQAMISGVHVYTDRALIELAPSPPLIMAKRAGTEWQSYSSK